MVENGKVFGKATLWRAPRLYTKVLIFVWRPSLFLGKNKAQSGLPESIIQRGEKRTPFITERTKQTSPTETCLCILITVQPCTSKSFRVAATRHY